MFLQRSLLLLLAFICMIFLVGKDWLFIPETTWYRPFIIGLLTIGFSAWVQRNQDNDEY